jgi:hypothetical protein
MSHDNFLAYKGPQAALVLGSICRRCKTATCCLAAVMGDNCEGCQYAWVAYNDDRGIHVDNPSCYCGDDVISRQNRAVAYIHTYNGSCCAACDPRTPLPPGWGVCNCATGRCDYYSPYKSDRTVEEMKSGEPEGYFVPWLLLGL